MWCWVFFEGTEQECEDEITRLRKYNPTRPYKIVREEMKKDLTEVVVHQLSCGDKGKPCRHSKKNWYPINCMQHNFEHVVGAGCYRCNKHWFWEDDWRSDECRRADHGKKEERGEEG